MHIDMHTQRRAHTHTHEPLPDTQPHPTLTHTHTHTLRTPRLGPIRPCPTWGLTTISQCADDNGWAPGGALSAACFPGQRAKGSRPPAGPESPPGSQGVSAGLPCVLPACSPGRRPFQGH